MISHFLEKTRNRVRLRDVLSALESFFEKNELVGWDPYDGLNSGFLRTLSFNRKWLRIAATQFMKRSSINFRPMVGIAKSKNPKAMGLLASSYLRRWKETRNQNYSDKARGILDWLIANSTGSSGYSWGHNFDWQSAVFYIPKGVPTVVNTAFTANAFLDAYDVFREKNYLDIARSSCDFILHDLNRTKLSKMTNDIMTNETDVFCFSYSPVDKNCCHNANLLAGALLARVYAITKENILFENAKQAVDFTISYQNSDSSWYYGLLPRQHYVDSFHTGFVLVSLFNYIQYIGDADGRYKQAMIKGYEYYKRTFFEHDGRPHYYSNKIYPIDLHCSAQGVITFLTFKQHDKEAKRIAGKIAGWAIANMWDEKRGYFYFQKTSYFTNKIPYLRWPNVWMYYALSLLDSLK